MSHRCSAAELLALRTLVRLGLDEDHAHEDLTSSLAIDAARTGRFLVRNRTGGIAAGIEAVAVTLAEFESVAVVEQLVEDGSWCAAGTGLARIAGPVRAILAAERTFLNLIGALSGTATLTRSFVDAVGPDCRVLDTRKTLPGYRLLQKYAVRCGGGYNHRMHLADGFLLKDNHRSSALDLPVLVDRARRMNPNAEIVVEVDHLDQIDQLMELAIDRVLLDNFDAPQIAEARMRRDRAGAGFGLEVSGRVDLARAAALAAAGAEYLSIGALTHSAPVWDVGLDEAEAPA